MGQSRNENILENMLGASNPLGEPQSREEALLMQLIDKVGGKILTGTLPAGSTTITLSDPAITTDSMFDYYTDAFGVCPTNSVVTNGQITLTFEARDSDLGVKVKVI